MNIMGQVEKTDLDKDIEILKGNPQLWELVPEGEWKRIWEARQYTMSRSYVHVWNGMAGTKKRQSSLLKADENGQYPIKCTLYISSKLSERDPDAYHRIYEDCKKMFERRIEDVYNKLKETGDLSTSLQDRFEEVLGKGQYEGEGLASEKFEDVSKKLEQQQIPPTERRKKLKSFASLLPRQLLGELAFIIAQHSYKKGFHTSEGPRLTFYPVQDWFPYLLPVMSTLDKDKLMRDLEGLGIDIPESDHWSALLKPWMEHKHNGNNEDEPIECSQYASTKKGQGSYNEVNIIMPKDGPFANMKIYVKCAPNPNYGPYVFTYGKADELEIEGKNETDFMRDIADDVITHGLKGGKIAAKPTGGGIVGITYEDALGKQMSRVDLTNENKFPNRGFFRTMDESIFKISEEEKETQEEQSLINPDLFKSRQKLKRIDLSSSMRSLSLKHATVKYAQNIPASWFDYNLNAYNNEESLIGANEELWQMQDMYHAILEVANIIMNELPQEVEQEVIEVQTAPEQVKIQPEQVDEIETKEPSVLDKGKEWIKEKVIEPAQNILMPQPSYQPAMASKVEKLKRLASHLDNEGYEEEARRIELLIKKYQIK